MMKQDRHAFAALPGQGRAVRQHRSPVPWLLVILALGTVLLALPFSVGAQDSPAQTRLPEPLYEFRQGSRDGIGKFYFGREISQVMGHRGAGWLERRSREEEERTDLLIQSLPLEPGFTVADIGAGTGYFSFPIARRLPRGQVLAVDIQPEMLSIVKERSERNNVGNVQTVLGTISDPKLPAGAVDLILLVDAYHEFSHPAEMGQAMAAALRPGGALVLIEYRAEDPSVPIKRLHKMSEAQARREIEALGLSWERTETMLPQQHFMVFRKPSE